MPLGMEVWPRPKPHCYMGTQLPPKGAKPPILGPCLLRSPISASAEHLYVCSFIVSMTAVAGNFVIVTHYEKC